MTDQVAVEQIREFLVAQGAVSEEAASRISKKYMNRKARRPIPRPAQLSKRMDMLISMFQEIDEDNNDGDPFITKKILDVHRKRQAMVEQGYYSDAPDRAYYRDIGGKCIKRYPCKRGTSGLEAFHYHLRRFLDSFSTDASLVNVLFHWFIAVWNQRALTKNCGYNNYGMYDMALLEEIHLSQRTTSATG